jgi:hypothetical protein
VCVCVCVCVCVMAQVCISIFTVEYVGRVMSVPFSSFLDNSTQLGIDIFQRKFVYLGESRMNRLWNYITEVRVRVWQITNQLN